MEAKQNTAAETMTAARIIARMERSTERLCSKGISDRELTARWEAMAIVDRAQAVAAEAEAQAAFDATATEMFAEQMPAWKVQARVRASYLATVSGCAMDKALNVIYSVIIDQLMQAGDTMPDAFDKVYGAGSWKRMSDECWKYCHGDATANPCAILAVGA